MSEPRELELKLEVGPKQLARLRTHMAKTLGQPAARKQLNSVYFDTPDQTLRNEGLSLRLRSAGGKVVQTVKQADNGPGIGLFDRSEWETEVAGEELDLAAAAETPLRKLLGRDGVGRLQPMFSVKVERTTWEVESDAASIEVALDAGTIASDGTGRMIAELELELKRGSAADLFALARGLESAGSLKIGIFPKSEYGYLLASGGKGPEFHKAEAVKLRRGTPTADAVAAIIRACIRHFRLNEAGVVEARRMEALHQARVAIRRLRSALSLFKDLLADPESQGIRELLRGFSSHLGEARNLDVYLARAEAPEEGQPEPDPDWIGKLRADREAAYDRVAKAFASKRYRGLMLDLLAWAEDGAWRKAEEPRLARPVEELAAAILDKRRRRVRRRGRDLAGIDAEARHQVRIEAKKLRYAAEFFSGLVEGKKDKKRLKAFLSATEHLQEALGELNDFETAKALHADRAEVGTLGLETVLDEESREQELLDAAVAAHRTFSDKKPFWRDFA